MLDLNAQLLEVHPDLCLSRLVRAEKTVIVEPANSRLNPHATKVDEFLRGVILEIQVDLNSCVRQSRLAKNQRLPGQSHFGRPRDRINGLWADAFDFDRCKIKSWDTWDGLYASRVEPELFASSYIRQERHVIRRNKYLFAMPPPLAELAVRTKRCLIALGA